MWGWGRWRVANQALWLRRARGVDTASVQPDGADAGGADARTRARFVTGSPCISLILNAMRVELDCAPLRSLSLPPPGDTYTYPEPRTVLHGLYC